MGKTAKIIDQFTNLPVSRQRKYQLRHPELAAEQRSTFMKTEAGHKLNRRNYVNNQQHQEWYNEYQKQYRIKKLLNE